MNMGKKDYKITITDTFIYNVEVAASSKNEAIEKAKKMYGTDGYLGVADGFSFDKSQYKAEIVNTQT